VGLKLDVEPSIALDDEVTMKVALEVSSIIGTVTRSSGLQAYRLGTRNTSTMLRVRDGETQVLAGLIQHEDRRGGVVRRHIRQLYPNPLTGQVDWQLRLGATGEPIDVAPSLGP